MNRILTQIDLFRRLRGHIEIGMPFIIVAVLLGLFTWSQDELATWLCVALYIVAGILFIVGLLNLGTTGMADYGNYSLDDKEPEKDREDQS